MKMSKITDVIHQGGRKGKLGPVVVNFEHGGLIDESSTGIFSPSLSYEFPDGSSSHAPPQVDLSLTGGHVKYSTGAKSVKGIRPSPYMKTYLAVRNKSTNQIKLYESNQVRVGAITRNIPTTNPVLLKEDEEEEMGEVEKREERKRSKKHLVTEFGQTKGRRIYEQADRMQVASEVLTDKLNQTAMNVADESIQITEQKQTMVLTPPQNRSAQNVSQVYKVNDILSTAEREELNTWAREFKEEYPTTEEIEKAIKNKKISELMGQFMIKHFDENSDEDFDVLGLAIYAEAILKLLRMRARELDKGPKALTHLVPFKVAERMIQTFIENSRLTPETRDRCMCYVIIVTLLINNFKFELNHLTASTRIKADQLKKLIATTGAQIIQDFLTGHSTVILKLPLASFDATRKPMKAKR